MSPSIQLRTGIFKHLEDEFLVKLDSWHQSKRFHGGSKGKKKKKKELLIKNMRTCHREIEKTASQQEVKSIVQFSNIGVRKQQLNKFQLSLQIHKASALSKNQSISEGWKRSYPEIGLKA